MRRAIARIRRERVMFICLKCGEEKHSALASRENFRICQACWDDYDMGRFDTLDEWNKQEEEAKEDA